MNLEVKPSFFSIAGFLAPGFFTLTIFVSMWGKANPCELLAVYEFASAQKLEGAAGVVIGFGVVAVLLAFAFVLGSFLSECANFIGRKLLLRWIAGDRLDLIDKALGRALSEQFKQTLNHREAFVYMQTCGLDLHWYAGRNRMLMGSGLGLLLVAGYSAFVLPCPAAIKLTIAGLACGAMGVYRSYKFDEYVAAAAAVLHALGSKAPSRTETEQ